MPIHTNVVKPAGLATEPPVGKFDPGGLLRQPAPALCSKASGWPATIFAASESPVALALLARYHSRERPKALTQAHAGLHGPASPCRPAANDRLERLRRAPPAWPATSRPAPRSASHENRRESELHRTSAKMFALGLDAMCEACVASGREAPRLAKDAAISSSYSSLTPS